jgi:hypothetical protein
MRYRYVLGLVSPLLVVAALSGCGGAASTPGVATAEPTGSGTGATAAGQVGTDPNRWAGCMQSAGVAMSRTAEGNYQVDKSKVTDLDKITRATQKCLPLQPSASVGATISAADLTRARQLSVCIRGHGVPDYPDPDPQTGTAQLSPAQSLRLKSDQKFLAALDACRDPRAASTGIAGG